MFKKKPPVFATRNRSTILPSKVARIVNDLVAVLLFAVSLSVGAMLYTHSNTDPGWINTNGYTDYTTIHNTFGFTGAYISDILLCTFGISSIWFAFGIFYLGYRKIVRAQINVGGWFSIIQICAFIVLLLCSTIVEYIYFFHSTLNALPRGYGGIMGNTFSNMLLSHVSWTLFFSTSLLIMFVCIVIVFGRILLDAALYVGMFVEWVFLHITSRKPRLDETCNTNDDTFDYDENDPVLSNIEDEVPEKEIIKSPKPSVIKTKAYAPCSKLLPSTKLLNEPKAQPEATVSRETINYVSGIVENKLSEFGIQAQVTDAQSGPVITRYEIMPPKGVRGDKIANLDKDIARALALPNVRILETIPGKSVMGIEVPNFKRQIIYLKEIFESAVYAKNTSKLTLALGKDIAGKVTVTDLAKMPHLLVAGTTGSGKSVAINIMILSILFQATPDEVKFIMIDPKMVELSFYQDIPHLLTPVVTDMTEATNALKWAVGQMEWRYRVMAKLGCKNIDGFNQKIADAAKANKPIFNPLVNGDDEPEELRKWPYVVIIIDELADLMMVTGKKTEQYIARIAQKARAIGIHLIVATQRPSVDVITGLIKANIPARISFQVSSKIDSRTILDQMGAEALLGQGDMLYLQPGSGFVQRVHGAYVNDDELHKVVDFLKSTGRPEYEEDVLSGNIDSKIEVPGMNEEGNDTEKDSIYDEAVQFIHDSKRCSISALQTRFGIGYNRAARIMSHMEQIGLVRRTEKGGFEISKPS